MVFEMVASKPSPQQVYDVVFFFASPAGYHVSEHAVWLAYERVTVFIEFFFQNVKNVMVIEMVEFERLLRN